MLDIKHDELQSEVVMLWQAPLAGRLLYNLQLAPIVKNVTTKLDPADQACIL